MKQKLALCCALIHKPTVLFLDEPTTGVDPVSRKEFWEMLKRLKKEGISILVSTPYMDEATLCDRIALMQKSKILKIDSPQAIIDSYPLKIYKVKSINTIQLLNEINSYSSRIFAYPFGEYIHVTFKEEDFMIEELQNHLALKGLNGVTIEPGDVSIEDCFIHLLRA
jgi:ABC-2 type transport system ATP-binding protein